MQLFGTKGQKFHNCPGTKGQAKNLAKGQDGPGQPKSGKGHGTKRDRAEKDVLKQKKDVLNQVRTFQNRKVRSKAGKNVLNQAIIP